ncbi:hypothetical protein [Streptomyces scabiei]|uniref:hypothetical protein n=1 Tax=Streptomyces scabiei TaxID=1930 RepID=UPI0029AB4D75|nr:hypothetical protein [Streptomyces scabiei]MDX3202089.1 hypothetical protein [Streptomyces scabiei]MDX3217702.1 hypothetical protein [Streptomyces scabiei]
MSQSAQIVMVLIALALLSAALVPTRKEEEPDPPYATFDDSTWPLSLPCQGWCEGATEHREDDGGDDSEDGATCITCGTPRTECALDQL